MKEVHLTNASIPGVRCLRDMTASTNKRRRDTTYARSIKTEITIFNQREPFGSKRMKNCTGNRKAAIQVRIAEQTRHRIASTLEGKLKNHPAQCITPNTTPTMGTTMKYANSVSSSYME